MTTTTKTSCPSPSTASPSCSPAPLAAARHVSHAQNPPYPTQPQDLPEKDDKELRNVVLEAHHGYTPCDLIDNTQLVYVPLKLPRTKVRVMVRPEVLVQCPEVLGILDDDVAQCCKVLPKSVHRLVRRTRLWVNHTYVYGPKATPIRMNHTTTHHHQAWLERVGDRGDKALGIEIYNCWDFMRMRQHWNGCGLLLHEVCHLLHQMCLGLDNELVWHCYRQAQHGGKYQCTLRRDWAVYKNESRGDAETDQHYCMVDQKEFFAEMSVTFLASGYTRWDHCRCYNVQRGMWNPVVRVSPPLMEPSVVARVYGGQPMATPPNRTIQSLYEQCVPLQERHRPPQHCFATKRTQPRPHCNKFYPFTRGQFRHYDPQLFCVFEQIWNEGIAKWKDPEPADDNEEEDVSDDDCCFVLWGKLCPPKWFPWRREPKVSAMVGW